MKKNGFTLVEIIIVIAILGLLAAMVVPRLRGIYEEAVLSEGISIASTVKNSCDVYYTKNGSITTKLSDLAHYIEITDIDRAGWNAEIKTGLIQDDYSIDNGTNGFTVVVEGSGNPGEISADLKVMLDNSGKAAKTLDGSNWRDVD